MKKFAYAMKTTCPYIHRARAHIFEYPKRRVKLCRALQECRIEIYIFFFAHFIFFSCYFFALHISKLLSRWHDPVSWHLEYILHESRITLTAFALSLFTSFSLDPSHGLKKIDKNEKQRERQIQLRDKNSRMNMYFLRIYVCICNVDIYYTIQIIHINK